MSLKTQVSGEVCWFQLLEAMEAIVTQASLHNPTAYRHFCQRDVERLAGLSNAVQYIVNKTPIDNKPPTC